MKAMSTILALGLLVGAVGCKDDEAIEDAKTWYRPWFVEDGTEKNPMLEPAVAEQELPDPDAPGEALEPSDDQPEPEQVAAAPADGPTADAREVTIKVKRGETLKLYSQWSGTEVADLRELNALKKRGLRIGQAFKLQLDPKGYRAFTEARTEYFSNQEKRFFARWGVARLSRYTIRKGDNVWAIAKRHDRIPVWVLEKFNSNVNLARLRVGDEVLVPILTELSNDSETAAGKLWASKGDKKRKGSKGTKAGKRKRRAPKTADTTGFTVTVSKRETLGHYSQWSGVSVKEIVAVNPGLKPNRIVLGQKIFVPVPDARLARFFKQRRRYNGTPPPADVAGRGDQRRAHKAGDRRGKSQAAKKRKRKKARKTIAHRVARGETAWIIAVKRYKIGLAALKSANPGKDLTRLQVGDVLRIPRRASRPGAGRAEKTP